MGVPETSVDKYQFYQFAQPAKHDVRFGGWPALPQTGVPLPSFARAGIHNRLHRDRRCRLSSTKLQQCPRDCDASTRPDKTDRLPTSLRDIGHPRRSYGRTMKYAGWIRLLVFGALLCSRAGAVGIPHFGVGDLVNSSNLIVLGGWPRSQRRSYAVEGAPGPSPLGTGDSEDSWQ